MPQIAKPLLAVSLEDLQMICDAGWREDEQIDFKRAVPHKEDLASEPWLVKRSISNHGRDQLLAAVVAFANSYGGDLLIGIAESDDEPGLARAISAIPDCVDLAARLSQQANACIEPHLSSLEVRGIQTLDDGGGVVVMRVSQSRNAPHRLTTTKDCYHRVRDQTLSMTMRQIQDLTFDVARGAQRIDERFSSLDVEYRRWLGSRIKPPHHRRYSVRLSFVPLSDVFLQNVHEARIGCAQRQFSVKVGNSEHSCLNHAHDADWRPMLRGTRATTTFDPTHTIASLHCDGACTVGFDFTAAAVQPNQSLSRESFVIYWGWLLGLMCGGLKTIDAFRSAAGSPQTEYAAEFVISPTEAIPIIGDGHYDWGKLSGDTAFPRYLVGQSEMWTDLLSLFYRDIRNAVGANYLGEIVELKQ